MVTEEISLMRVFWIRKRFTDKIRDTPHFQRTLEEFILRTNEEPATGQIWKLGDKQPDGSGSMAFSIKSAQLSVHDDFDIEFELHPYNFELARRIELGLFTIEPRGCRLGITTDRIFLISFDLKEKEKLHE